MPTSTEIRKQLALDGADPFQIAADALARVAALEAQLSAYERVPRDRCSGARQAVLLSAAE